ncbi:MAG: DUF2752 domain-containing protein [Minicystis sp.]
MGARQRPERHRPVLIALPPTPLGRAARLLAFGAALAALVATGVPLCPIAAVTRHPCPGCGLTRAAIALAQGRFAEAVRLHPLAPVVVPLVVGSVAWAAIVYVRHGRWPGATGRAAGWIAAVGIAAWVLLTGVWLARFYGAFGGPAPV